MAPLEKAAPVEVAEVAVAVAVTEAVAEAKAANTEAATAIAEAVAALFPLQLLPSHPRVLRLQSALAERKEPTVAQPLLVDI